MDKSYIRVSQKRVDESIKREMLYLLLYRARRTIGEPSGAFSPPYNQRRFPMEVLKRFLSGLRVVVILGAGVYIFLRLGMLLP